MTCKVIIQGWLDFDSVKRFEKVEKMLVWRAETHYKNESLLIPEKIFDPENRSITIQRLVEQATRKTWSNTIHLLEYAAEFAVTGKVDVWIAGVHPNRHHFVIEPKSDRDVVTRYREAVDLLHKKESTDAVLAFREVLRLHADHYLAHLGLMDAFLQLGEPDNAWKLIPKALKLRTTDAGLYIRKGMLALQRNLLDDAIAAFEQCTQYAIALESVYWKARFYKGLALMAKSDWQAASKEFNFFVAKVFEKSDENYLRRPEAHFRLAQCFVHLDQHKQALSHLDSAEKLDTGKQTVARNQLNLYRGLARKGAGYKDYETYLNKAGSAGTVNAEEILEEAFA